MKKDPTAFYTYEEFETGVDALRQFCSLRSQSISTQLETGETDEKMEYADASSISLTDMGTMKGRVGKEGNEKLLGMPQNRETPAIPEKSDAAQTQADLCGAISETSDLSVQSFHEAETKPLEDSGSADVAENNSRSSGDNRPSGDFNPNMHDVSNSTSNKIGWIWLIISVWILGIGLMIAKLYK